MKSLKRIAALAVSASLLIRTSTCLNVDASGLRDVFNAKYYADKYQDLKDAFGYDEEALYQHYLQYGLEENRDKGNNSYVEPVP